MLIGIGYGAYQIKLLTPSIHDELNRFVLRIPLPALLFCAMLKSGRDIGAQLLAPMLIGGLLLFIFLLIFGILSAKLLGIKGDLLRVQTGLISFPSTGFFGIPLVEALLGSTGVVGFALYSIVDGLTVWTMGVFLSTSSEEKFTWSLREVFKKLCNPAMIAIVAGLVLMPLSIPQNNLIIETLYNLGSCCGPLAMICIGVSLARSNSKSHNSLWLIVQVIIVRMLLTPLLVWSICSYLNVFSSATICLTLLAGIPSSSMFSLMCHENGNTQADYASKAAVATVCASIITLPLIFFLIQTFHL